MGSRERKRAERRKRKQRSAEASTNGAPEAADPAARMSAASERKNEAAREALQPLAKDERPLVVTLGAIVSALLVLSTLVAYAAGAEVDGKRPLAIQVIAPSLLLGIMAWGMWRARYWAVLGFQVVLLFLILAAAFGLVQAANPLQILGNVALLAVAGAFFYFMVKALARIQMPDRMPRE